jgi:hypothetical protein
MGYRYAYHDDPIEDVEESKSLGSRILYYLSALAIVAVTGTTFASNISLTNSGSTEFGQGFLTTTACSEGNSLSIRPTNIFDGTNYLVKSVTVSNIPTSCAGNDFILNASVAQSLPNGSAVYSGSNSQYLNAGTNSGFNFGTGNFTIEGWYNFANVTPPGGSPSLWIMENGDAYFMVIIRAGGSNTGMLSLYWNFTPATGDPWNFQNTANNTIAVNAWTHIAAMRNGDTYSLFVNGKCVATASGMAANQMGSSALPMKIGANVNGKIANFRVVKGSLAYNYGTSVGTTYFTPPTSVLSAISGTQLLLNTPFGANFLMDMSPNNISVTNTGSVTSSAESPFPGSYTQLPASFGALYAGTSTTAVVHDNAGNFFQGANSLGTTVTTNSSSPTGSFTVSFDTPTAIASTVVNLTLQSAPHS